MPKARKSYTLRVELPRIGHYREYPTPPPLPPSLGARTELLQLCHLSELGEGLFGLLSQNKLGW